MAALTVPNRGCMAMWCLCPAYAGILTFAGVRDSQLNDLSHYNVFSDTWYEDAAEVPARELLHWLAPRQPLAKPRSIRQARRVVREARRDHAICFRVLGAVGVSGLILCDRMSFMLCSRRTLPRTLAIVLPNWSPSYCR